MNASGPSCGQRIAQGDPAAQRVDPPPQRLPRRGSVAAAAGVPSIARAVAPTARPRRPIARAGGPEVGQQGVAAAERPLDGRRVGRRLTRRADTVLQPPIPFDQDVSSGRRSSGSTRGGPPPSGADGNDRGTSQRRSPAWRLKLCLMTDCFATHRRGLHPHRDPRAAASPDPSNPRCRWRSVWRQGRDSSSQNVTSVSAGSRTVASAVTNTVP